jgi:NADH-quinone oxidoreductase subunit C
MLQLHNLPENVQVRIKCFTDEVNPSFKTFTTLWPAANWMEREAYDFFGFNFEGHPDLRRILNMDSLEGWPLRKEFPLEDPFRRDKDDKMFGR